MHIDFDTLPYIILPIYGKIVSKKAGEDGTYVQNKQKTAEK